MHYVDVRNVSLGQIMYFVRVAESMNVTRTAEYFNITQSALSKKLASLEKQLDLQLFFRTNRITGLTPAGRYLYEEWKNMANHLEENIQYAHVLQAGQSKNIVVGCMDSFNPEMFLIPLIGSFGKKHPDIHLRIESDSAQDLRRMLIRKEVDVLFSILYDYEGRTTDAICWKEIGETCHCVCMKKTNPLADREVLHVDDLKWSDFVCISPQYLPEYARMINSLCAEYGFAPNVTGYVGSAHSLTLNIKTDNEIFICDKYYADGGSADHVLVPLEGTKSSIVVAWWADNEKPYLQDLIDEASLLLGENE